MQAAHAKVWTLADRRIQVDFDDRTALLTVTDKRIGKVWRQGPLDGAVKVNRVEQQADQLTVSLSGGIDFVTVFTLNAASELEVRLQADKDLPATDLHYPAAFHAPDEKHYLLHTDSQGILLPMKDTGYPLKDTRMFFCGGGMAMAWSGIVDFQFESGYMAIVETPFDGKLVPFRGDGRLSFKPAWLPTLGKFGYERSLRYVFFDRGGYVAQAKRYRTYAWEKNRVITLKERLKKTPALDKMVGAAHVYLWDEARQLKFAQAMKEAGIERAFIQWNPNHPPYPPSGYDTEIAKLGYATGVYELTTDLHLRDKTNYPVDDKGPLRYKRTQFPGLFDELVVMTKDGGTVFNHFGHTTSPAAVRPHIFKRIDREMQEYPHEAYFLDVYAANGLFEDYSPKHVLSRTQFAEEVIKTHQQVAEKYKVYLGAEWGADYLAGEVAYAHGMMTLQMTWWNTEGVNTQGSIYYSGDWRNGPRPTQMVGSRVANDSYLNYSINEYARVPLFELVYHDAIVTSWRWEDGNHHMPEIWWKKDLFNILYGNVPLWSVDRQRWEEYQHTFVESYRTVVPWAREVGYDEMLSHRFLTADHQVQESVFSSGKTVWVNFGAEAAVVDGRTVPAKGFLKL